MAVKRDVFGHAHMGCQMQLGGAAGPCILFEMIDQKPAKALALGVGVDGNVHQMSRGAVERQDRAAGKLAVEFGHKNMMIANVLGKTGGDVGQVRQA